MKLRFRPFIVFSLAGAPFALADTLPLTLQGSTSADVWGANSLGADANPGFPGALNYTLPWPSSIPTSNGGDAFLTKLANGPTGGPIPSGQSIYFVSFANLPNTFGGTLAINDTTPLPGVSTLSLQIEIGGANGYDLFNNNLALPPDLSTVKLHYTTTGGATGTLNAGRQALLDRFYTFAIDMPTGPNGEDRPEDIYNRLYGLQWDLSGIGTLSSCQIEFSGAEHAQLYQLRLDQSSHAYGTASVFPQDAVWTAGSADTLWDTGGNWQEAATPGPGRNIRFTTGSEAVLTSAATAKSLTFATAGSFSLGGTASALTLTSGINTDSPAGTSHQIPLPLVFEKYNLIELAENNTLTLSGPLTGAGFYKQGAGNLILTGNNTYDGTNPSLQINGLIFRGGETTITGTNTLIGGGPTTFNIRPDTTVRLSGGDQRVDPRFTANLLGPTSRLILGGESGKSDQTFAALAGSVTNVPVTGSKILGGAADHSTLTIHSTGTAVFAGDIGGPGVFENHLNVLKTGPGLQFLAGGNTYTGFTTIKGGALVLDPTGRSIELSGGVLGLDDADLTADLGTQPGNLRFTGSGGFAANGTAPHRVTLNGGASLAWNATGFLADHQALLLSASGTNQTIDFTNPLDLGSSGRVIHVEDSLHNTDARLSGAVSGSGGFAKTGPGILELTAANPTTGTVRVHAGTLTLAGENGTFAGSITAEPGSFIRITNTSTAARDHRLSPGTSTTLRGAFLTFTGAPNGTAETTGPLIISNGANTLSTNRADAGSSSFLTFASLGRGAGTTLNFSGTGIGLADARAQVHFTAPPALTNQLIGGWAVAANEFATYGAAGVTALTAYVTSAESSWTAADNIKLTAGEAAAPTAALTAPRGIHSLRLVGATGGTFGNVLDLGGNPLRIHSGGVLTNSGSDTRTSKITNGTLTADSELILFANGPTDISATIADPAAGTPLSVVKSGSQVLTLQAPSTHTGATVVNQGVLRLSPNASLSSSPIIQLNTGGTLNVADFPSFAVPSSQTLTGTGTVNGSLTVSGTLAPAASAQTPLTISGGLSFAAGSALSIPIEANASLPLNGSIKLTGSVTVPGDSRLAIQTDASSTFWSQPRSFRILTAGSFNGTPAFTIESDLTNGAWSLNLAAGSLILDWVPASPLQLWRKTHFDTFDNTGDAADLADPDRDGLVNFLEYALGTSPAAHSPIPSLNSGRELTFEIPLTPPAGITYEVQVSDDLSVWKALAKLAPNSAWAWSGEGPSRITLVPAAGATQVTVGDETLSPAPGRRFLRLKAGQP